MPRYEEANWGDITNHIFAKGIITAVDSENDTADVTVPGYQNGTAIPLFYHCSDDAEERDNGALEGAAAAFSAGTEDDPEDGDEVIVMVDATTEVPIRIIGFVDGIRECYWEPWNGPEIDSKNSWGTISTDVEVEIVNADGEPGTGWLHMNMTAGHSSLGRMMCELDEPKECNHVAIKCTPNITNEDGYLCPGYIALLIYNDTGEWAWIIVAEGEGRIPACEEDNVWHNVCVYDGFEPGEEIEVDIDISEYFTTGFIDDVGIYFVDMYHGDPDLMCDYIHFYYKE